MSIAPPTSVLTDPPSIDPEWMHAALVESGAVSADARLEAVTFEQCFGTGQLGRSARFHLTWADGSAGPASVVSKIPGMEPEVTKGLFESGMYSAETAFYNLLADHTDVVRPHCYFAGADPETQTFMIMMEDLAGHKAGDHIAGISLDNISRAVEQAALLHGPSWNDPHLADIPYFVQSLPGKIERNSAMYQACAPQTLERLGSRLSDEAVELVERSAGVMELWLKQRGGSPMTVVHGDFRPDNFLISPTDTERPLVVVDWQTMSIGTGATDVAYLLGGALDADGRHAVEADLLKEYLGHLHQRYGLTKYTESDLRRDYASGTMAGVIVAVTAAILALRTERGDDLFTLMIERHATHARELGAMETINQLEKAS